MRVNTVFDRLVTELSKEERRQMLDKINRLVQISDEPLAAESDEKTEVDLGAIFNKLGFFQKIVFFFKMLFSGKNREELLEERALREIAKDIQRRSSLNIMDFTRGQFLPAFGRQLRELRDNVVIFTPIIDKVLGQSKPDFIAFLVGLEIDDIQRRLLLETDPFYQIAKHVGKGEVLVHEKDLPGIELPPSSELGDVEIKRMMENALDDVLQFIPADGRAGMYQNMKFLHYLAVLTSFPFERLLKSFYPAPDVNPVPCSFQDAKDLVMRLADILSSMTIGPSPRLIRSLFLFTDGEKAESKSYNLEEDYTEQIKAADRAMKEIRSFNASQPMFLIARYLSGDVNYQCANVGGGEDWFALLKQFWRARIDQSYKEFSLKRKQDEIVKEIHSSLGGIPMVFLDGYVFTGSEGKTRGTYSLSMGFLKTFFANVFPSEFNRYLKILLIEGEFYKDDNRSEFTDAYNGLLKVQTVLEDFEKRLSAAGDFGMALRQAEQEMESKLVKQKKIKSIRKRIDLEAQTLIQNAQGNLQSLVRILTGILHGEVGGRYDTLSNYGYIGGRGNQAFLKSLDKVLRQAQQIGDLIEKLYVLENTGV